MLLQVTRLSLVKNHHALLREVALGIKKREIHALLGANGSGKSSLAYTLMGCAGYRPTEGDIRFAGESITDLPIDERARRGITLAWQEPARFEGLAVRDYLSLGPREVEPEALLERVGLAPEDYLARPVDKTLSGGERKRIELAAVLAMQPKLAILDEPAAGIDLLSLDEITQLILTLKQAGSAVLLITHREDMAARADAASQLCGGRIVCRGDPARVIENFKARVCRRCDGETCENVSPHPGPLPEGEGVG